MTFDKKRLFQFITRMIGRTVALLAFSGIAIAEDTLRVYHHQDYPPLEFVDNAGNATGFDMDVWRAVAAAAELNYHAAGISWDSLVTVTKTGEFDVLTGMYYRVSQKDQMHFSMPYLTVNYSLFVPSGSPIQELHDPVAKRVVIVGGGVSSKLIDDVYAISDVKKVRGVEEAIALLHNNSYDCAVLPTLQARYYIHFNDIEDVVSVGGNLLSRNLCFAVSPGDSLLLDKINTGLTTIQENGILKEIRKTWIAPYEENFLSWRVVIRAGWILVVGLTIIGIGVVIWTRSLQHSVKARTRELRQEIRERERIAHQLAQSNDLKALLIDIITHDLKNPVSVIKGMTELIEQQGLSDEMLPVIRQSSENLLKVMENATTLADLAVGERIEKQEMELSGLIRQIVDEFSPELESKGMAVELNLDGEYRVSVNPIIAAVFRNYLSNAIKYASEGKKVIIEADNLDDYLEISVKDFGKTLPESARMRVFERAFQIDKSSGHGRGLGLAIVKRIAEAHGGEVGVRPNEPNGNIFYIRLPR